MMSPNTRTDRIIDYSFVLLTLVISVLSIAYLVNTDAAKATNAPKLVSGASSDEPANILTQTTSDSTLTPTVSDSTYALVLLGFLKTSFVTLARGVWAVSYHTPRFVLLHTPRGVIMLLGGLLQPLNPLLAPIYLALEILAFLIVGPLLFVLQVLRALYPLYTVAGAACVIGAGAGGLARWISLAATDSLFSSSVKSKRVKSRRASSTIKDKQDEKRIVKKEERE